MVALIVYDLPNRDCAAKASNGEICCKYNDDKTCDHAAKGDCDAGLREYKTEYIDKLAAVLKEYHEKVPVVLIIEPDSLPNLATNKADPRCGSEGTMQAYQEGIAYAVETLKTACPSCGLYLDAAHGGWLGWQTGHDVFMALVAKMGVAPYLRGFSTNVANYQALGKLCPRDHDCKEDPDHDCCDDPCGLIKQGNPANNELNYAQLLHQSASSKIAGFSPHFVIDTGRNGNPATRESCSNWCNIRGAGLGEMPSLDTADRHLIDAYYWLKTPGESDGCTQYLPDPDDPNDPKKDKGKCPRFDGGCASEDSLGGEKGEPHAPEAGMWFDYQAKQLAANAVWDKK